MLFGLPVSVFLDFGNKTDMLIFPRGETPFTVGIYVPFWSHASFLSPEQGILLFMSLVCHTLTDCFLFISTLKQPLSDAGIS